MAVSLFKKNNGIEDGEGGSAKLNSERRYYERIEWDGLGCTAVLPNEQRKLPFKGLDISSDGVSFETNELLDYQQVIVFLRNTRAVRVRIVWFECDEKDENLYRYGCQRLSREQDMYEILAG